MASEQWAVVLRQVQRLFQGGSVTGLTEGQLLDRFLETRDELAFSAIVARHGPMVFGVCRGVLNDPHDVEDAFQATFLLLVQKARGLRDRDRLGPWLHGVARRVALRARADASKRQGIMRSVAPEDPCTGPTLDAELRELQSLIHEEVDRLSAQDRMAIVVCYLQGLTHEEAAERLGWPIGTVKGRLSRAREKLKGRLSRRGISLPTVFAATSGRDVLVSLPAGLVQSTTQAAIRIAAGQPLTAGIVSAQVISLMEGMMKSMIATPLKIAGSILVAGSVLAAPGVLAYQRSATPPAQGLAPPAGSSLPKIANPEPQELPLDGPIQDNLIANRKDSPQDAREVSAEFARQALEALDESKLKGGAVSNEEYGTWSRRLVDAVSSPSFPKDLRQTLLKAHLKRLEANHEQTKRDRSKGTSKLATLESAYLLNEAYRLVLEAEAKPAVGAVAKDPDRNNGGGGFSDAPPMFPLHLKPNPLDEKRNEDILAKLEWPLAMKFATPTSLEIILKFVKEATQDKTSFPNGIPIYVDPQALEIAETQLDAKVVIDIEGIPLRTNLRLLLHQLRLNYQVEGGLLMIVDERMSDAFPRPNPGAMGGGAAAPGGAPGGFR